MMKNTRKTKRTFKVFAAWDYEFEEREFNRMSEQGWQLVNGGSFSQKYEYDDSVIYRYQLDYNNEIKDMARYDETFRDAGWERVNSTANGWHIFRKAYDKSLPDEERWRNVCFIFICIVPINIFNSLRIMDTSDAGYIGVGSMLACVLVLGMLIAGIFSINRMIKSQKNSRPYPMKFFIIMLLLLLAAIFAAAVLVLIQEGSYFALGLMAGLMLAAIAIAVKVVIAKKR